MDSPLGPALANIFVGFHESRLFDNTAKLGVYQNGYPAYVLLSCINQKLANFAAEKPFGPEKCPVYLKLPWIGNVSSKFENQISKAITSCYYAVKPCVVYNTRVMLPSAKKIAFLPLKKVVLFMNFRADVKLGT